MSIHAIPGHFPHPRIKTNQNPVHFSVHLAICMTICGAYAIRPYTGTRKNDDYFIPRIKTNRNPDKFSSGRVGAYCIRPTDEHVRGRTNPIPIRFLIHQVKTNQKPAQFSSFRVGRNSIRPTNGHDGDRTDRKIAIFSGTRVGAYCIRPTNGHVRGRMNLIPIRFLILRIKTNQNPDEFLPGRVGAYCIRPTDDHASGQMDRKNAIFQVARVGAYCIRPTDGHARGRTKLIPIRFLIHWIKTNQNLVHFSVRSTIVMVVCGAYAVAPYTGTRKNGDYSIHRIKIYLKSAQFSIPRVKRNPILAGFFIPRPKMNLKSIGFFNPGPKGMAVPVA